MNQIRLESHSEWVRTILALQLAGAVFQAFSDMGKYVIEIHGA